MSTDPASSTSAHPAGVQKHKESIQDTIISVVIAFTLAFVFRGFVVEAFVIPTGSMAPTLMGAHERIRSSETGYTWAVGPWYAFPSGQSDYKPVQGARPDAPLQVHDPMTGEELTRSNVPRKSGDRILVLKYLYMLMQPERFDVIVFKCPYGPQDNFIKRLVGLANEEIAIVDGDVFYRPITNPDRDARLKSPDGSLKNPWADTDWKIARKPRRVQDATWQTVFDSDFAPRGSVAPAGGAYMSPWTSKDAEWSLAGRRFAYTGSGATDLEWDSARLRYRAQPPTIFPRFDDFWEINDRYAYNETPLTGFQRFTSMDRRDLRPYFPVSDIRMSAGIEAGTAGLKAVASISARSHEFQLSIDGTVLTLRQRRVDQTDFITLATAAVPALVPGRVVNVEFVHVDQSLAAFIDGERVAYAEYNWGPDERIRMATQRTVDELLTIENGSGLDGDMTSGRSIFEDRAIYQKPRIKWSFDGAPVTLYRVKVERDLYYAAAMFSTTGMPSRGSHPKQPILLDDDQFFVCGDNSPASFDGRVWDPPSEWVKEIDPTWGVVPRKLILGKAFFVYYPAPTWAYGRVPVPDFGRMRFIW